MGQPPLTLKRWSRDEYERLVDLGMLRGEAVELVGGQLLVAEPQSSSHASVLGRAGDALRAALGAGWVVRVQMPVALDDESEPEPDLAVVPGVWADYESRHPTTPALAVEVSETSLAFDRGEKAGLYARGGLRDYWIINLVDRVLEVYRDPAPDDGAPHGWIYRRVERLVAPAMVSLLANPDVRIPVGELLP